jgi:hypothetical protein
VGCLEVQPFAMFRLVRHEVLVGCLEVQPFALLRLVRQEVLVGCLEVQPCALVRLVQPLLFSCTVEEHYFFAALRLWRDIVCCTQRA